MEFVVKGGDAPTPVVFGDYEIGRSRFDRGGGYLTAPFRDNIARSLAPQSTAGTFFAPNRAIGKRDCS